MNNYILKRVWSALVVIFVVSFITYFVLMFIPGDAAQLILGTEASAEKLAELRNVMGLNRPWIVQYADWLGGLLRLDFGESYLYGTSVLGLITQRLPVTLSVAVFSMLIASVFAVVLGVVSAIKRNTAIDYFSRSVMQIGSAIPSFWMGMIFIIYFGLKLKWFPISDYTPLSDGFFVHLKSLIMPCTVLAIGEIGMLLRSVRTSMIDTLDQDYMDMARVKGLKSSTVYFKYALRSAMIAPINVIGMQFAKLMGGTVVVESVFSLPGLGRLLLVAVEQRDIVLLQGIVMFITAVVVFTSLAVDIIVMLLNPKIRIRTRGE
ncbi:Glutathione transport system permease protein GsiC [bioreactor metagenome]|uniref:Glutathione transport system permease protein GsiC n=1 Tax=bioreactor metagenome TaxID=1076179 RepID=A0A644YU25_9ZZZZ|nr:ABC transporter permease [Candidatus Metalachnospira sp.]